MIRPIKRILIKILYQIFRIYFYLFKPVGIGVRTIILNDMNEVLLIEHTYKHGLYFPGGGVKKYEELDEASRREVKEEVNVDIENQYLFGVYRDITFDTNDVLFVFVASTGKNGEQIIADQIEIKSAKWYKYDKIPRNRVNQRCLLALDDYFSNNKVRDESKKIPYSNIRLSSKH